MHTLSHSEKIINYIFSFVFLPPYILLRIRTGIPAHILKDIVISPLSDGSPVTKNLIRFFQHIKVKPTEMAFFNGDA